MTSSIPRILPQSDNNHYLPYQEFTTITKIPLENPPKIICNFIN